MGKVTTRAHDLRVCRAIHLLAEGKSEDEVAQEVGVKRVATMAVWQQNEDFAALVECMKDYIRLREAFKALHELTPKAIDVLRERLASANDRVAVQAAKDVLDRVGLKAGAIKEGNETIIRFEYGTADGQPYTAPSWADRNPATSGTVQGGGVRETVREDGDGEDYDA